MTRVAAAAAIAVPILLAACSRHESASKTPALHLQDVTKASGIDFTPTSGKTPSTQILEVKGGGLALIDYDGDGDRDLFVPNGATLDSPRKGPGARLYANAGGMRFEDVSHGAALGFDRWGFGPAVGDYDADGKDDLYVACYGPNVLLHNAGGGRFDDVTAQAGVAGDVPGAAATWSTAAAWGDLDGDSDLDLYVVNYLEFDPAHPPGATSFLSATVFAGPMGLPAQPDVVYRNDGDGGGARFTDVTHEWGFDAVKPGYGLGAVILDFDQDGRQDVFVGNDSGKNNLFVRGDDGGFKDIASTSGCATSGDGLEQATMGIAVGDVNGDQRPDLFTTNFMNDTNTLHVNLGKRLFDDQTGVWGLGQVSRPYVGWATAFVDFDQDADEDVLVFDGHTYPREITEPHQWMHDQVPLFFERNAKHFDVVAAATAGAWLAEPHCDRSAVFDDLDGDGDVDVIVAGLNQPLRVLENDGAGPDCAAVELADERPTSKNRRGIGARVVLDAGGAKQTRWIHTGGSYQSANPPRAHFGLPAGTSEYRLEIDWPDGVHQTAEAQTGRRTVRIAHP